MDERLVVDKELIIDEHSIEDKYTIYLLGRRASNEGYTTVYRVMVHDKERSDMVDIYIGVGPEAIIEFMKIVDGYNKIESALDKARAREHDRLAHLADMLGCLGDRQKSSLFLSSHVEAQPQ